MRLWLNPKTYFLLRQCTVFDRESYYSFYNRLDDNLPEITFQHIIQKHPFLFEVLLTFRPYYNKIRYRVEKLVSEYNAFKPKEKQISKIKRFQLVYNIKNGSNIPDNLDAWKIMREIILQQYEDDSLV